MTTREPTFLDHVCGGPNHVPRYRDPRARRYGARAVVVWTAAGFLTLFSVMCFRTPLAPWTLATALLMALAGAMLYVSAQGMERASVARRQMVERIELPAGPRFYVTAEQLAVIAAAVGVTPGEVAGRPMVRVEAHHRTAVLQAMGYTDGSRGDAMSHASSHVATPPACVERVELAKSHRDVAPVRVTQRKTEAVQS